LDLAYAYHTRYRPAGDPLEKIGTGVALGGVGLVLAAYGYDGSALAQTVEAAQAVRLLMGPMPAVLLLLSVAVAWLYPLSRRRHEVVRAALLRRFAQTH
jgi:glycoside/pentoside/hexuronide:cation symporter, GPH family